MENYEALGKYVAAKERAAEIGLKRNQVFRLISKLASKFDSSGYGGDFSAVRFDEEQLQKLISEARELDQQLSNAMNDANANAPLCDKPELKWY